MEWNRKQLTDQRRGSEILRPECYRVGELKQQQQQQPTKLFIKSNLYICHIIRVNFFNTN